MRWLTSDCSFLQSNFSPRPDYWAEGEPKAWLVLLITGLSSVNYSSANGNEPLRVDSTL
ncbi:MAG: hypothetical protein Udaeo2_15260 [Candidatus Udaeobacter sp.]|nr:MAG: hypothetical protein Udaeo2_15260 [Candidatus Udaeobacter sp.]